jgi:hypothetical protein
MEMFWWKVEEKPSCRLKRDLTKTWRLLEIVEPLTHNEMMQIVVKKIYVSCRSIDRKTKIGEKKPKATITLISN